MNHSRQGIVAALLLAATMLSSPAHGQEPGLYARFAVLRPHDGKTVDFEAGYARHLEFHQKAGDKWSWYGWSLWAGDRQRWFVYATFGHTAEDLANPVSPAEDEKDNIVNVTPHCEFAGNVLYQFLPAISRGNGSPQVLARAEFTYVDLEPGTEKAFESALAAARSTLNGETLWYRAIAGSTAPRYLRIRSRPSLAAIIDEQSEQALPNAANALIERTYIEVGSFRPTMSYNLQQTSR